MSISEHLTRPWRSRAPSATGLTITVSAGAGSGLTRLAAFDAALRSAGVADFNLVRLSSVIPPQSVVREADGVPEAVSGEGALLFCVYADGYASVPGEQAWAGLAWSRHGTRGGGLFVEHTANSRHEVERDLGLSLAELSRGRGGGYTEAGRRVTSVTCEDRPACAVVVASYYRVGWGFGVD